MSERLPLALVIGVGGATGRSVCQRFAAEYRLVMLARSESVIGPLAAALPYASAYQCDVSARDDYGRILSTIVEEHGLPDVIVVNTEGGGWGAYHEIDLDHFAASFPVNVVALLALVQTLFPDPAAIRKTCRVVISSSEAAYHSDPYYLGLAPSRAGQRVVAESLDQVLAPHGVEFCVLSIAGAIDEPKMRAAFKSETDEFFIKPDAIADFVYVLTRNELPARARITNQGTQLESRGDD